MSLTPAVEYAFSRGDQSLGWHVGNRLLLANDTLSQLVFTRPDSDDIGGIWTETSEQDWWRVHSPVVDGNLLSIRRFGTSRSGNWDRIGLFSLEDLRLVADLDLQAASPSEVNGDFWGEDVPSYAFVGDSFFCHSGKGWLLRAFRDGRELTPLVPLPRFCSVGMVAQGGRTLLQGRTLPHDLGRDATSVVFLDVPSGKELFRYDLPDPEKYTFMRATTVERFTVFQYCGSGHPTGPEHARHYESAERLSPDVKGDRFVVMDRSSGTLVFDVRVPGHVPSAVLLEDGRFWFLAREEEAIRARLVSLSMNGVYERTAAEVPSGLVHPHWIARHGDRLFSTCDAVGLSSMDWGNKRESALETKAAARQIRVRGSSILVSTFARKVLHYRLDQASPKKPLRIKIEKPA